MANVDIANDPNLGLITIPPLTAAVPSVTFAGLDGDNPGAYEYTAHVKGAGVSSIFLRPNGLTTNQRSVVISSVDGATPAAAAAFASWPVIDTANTFASIVKGTIFTKRGAGGRGHISQAIYQSAGTPVVRVQNYSGIWTDDAALLTSIVIVSDLAGNGLGIGSWFTLRPLR